jgi:hypothetical protein
MMTWANMAMLLAFSRDMSRKERWVSRANCVSQSVAYFCPAASAMLLVARSALSALGRWMGGRGFCFRCAAYCSYRTRNKRNDTCQAVANQQRWTPLFPAPT